MSNLESTPTDKHLDALLLALFVGSGCAALIYEVVWFHLLRLAIGSSAISLAILLACFMGGMFLGSLLFSRLVATKYHPFKVYAVLELLIAFFGVLLPFILPAVSNFYVANTGYGFVNVMLRAFVCALCLLPATILMGATLPAISRWMETTRTGIAKVGFLYSANTIGAVIGTVLAGFYLLRFYDVMIATSVAVVLNLLVCSLGIWLGYRNDYQPVSVLQDEPSRTPGALPIYAVIALSGFTALGAQVVWTRLLSLLFGATVYTFSVILAVFLIGLGIGSSAGSFFVRRTDQPKIVLGLTQLFLITAIPYAAYMIKVVIPYVNLFGMGMSGADSAGNWLLHSINDIVRCALAILPATILWGASFPLALAANRQDQDPGYSVGRIYAANTVGAIFGALCASLIMIPVWGTRMAEQGLTLIAALAALLIFIYADWNKIISSLAQARYLGGFPQSLAMRPIGAAILVILTGTALTMIPEYAPGMIGYGRLTEEWERPQTYLKISEGLSSSVAVTQSNRGFTSLHVSGKPVASSTMGDMRLQRMLGHYPALFHGAPKSVLIIGFGAGVTAGSFVVHPSVERIVIVEIEPEVPAASGVFFKEENYDVLNDPRVELILDDARHYITTTEDKFDIITADPIHPWIKGAAALYSKEFFELSKARLNPGGIFTQWVPLYETDNAAVQSEIATFYNVFPNGSVWSSNLLRGGGHDTIVIGSLDTWQFDLNAIQTSLDRHRRLSNSLQSVRIQSAMDIMKTFAGQKVDTAAWLETAELNLDRNLRLEYLAGRALDLMMPDRIFQEMVANIRYPSNLAILSPEDDTHYRDWFEKRFGTNSP